MTPTVTEQHNNRRVWKFIILPFTPPEMALPSGAHIIHVAMQGEHMTLWALVDPDLPLASRRVYVCGTGHPVPDDGVYVGTVHHDDLVWHIFDGGES